MRVGAGVIALARLSGAPIIPITYGAARRRVLNTWDRFVFALPFGGGVLVWGEPVHVAPDAGAEAREVARLQLEARLNAICEEADRLCGVPPIEPAPEAGESRP